MNDPLLSHNAHVERAAQLLPAWFVERMMDDVWSFALILSNGAAVIIQNIDEIHQAKDGSIWLDVTLHEPTSWTQLLVRMGVRMIIDARTKRTSASINAAHIMAAFEIADT